MLQMTGNHYRRNRSDRIHRSNCDGTRHQGFKKDNAAYGYSCQTPISLEPVDMLIIICIKKEVSGTSIINILKISICGRVDPNS